MYTISPFKLTDMGTVIRLEQDCFPEDAFGWGTFLSLYWRGRDMFFVARDEQQIVGYLSAYMDGLCGYIASIAVSLHMRRQGLAQDLIETLRQRVISKQGRALTLHVRASNAPAVMLYKKLDFAVVATLPRYYHNGESAYYMRKPL